MVVTHGMHSQGFFKPGVSTVRTDLQRDPGMQSKAIETNSFSAVSTSFLTTLRLPIPDNSILEICP